MVNWILPKARQSRHVLVFKFSICYLLLFPHPREILRSAQNDGPERLSSQIAIGDTAGEQTATVEQIAIVFGSPIAVRKDGGHRTVILLNGYMVKLLCFDKLDKTNKTNRNDRADKH
ncbi:hypothetical protein A3I42_00360 [Candidatus Uhrbacteria bacterium RIFCSPLOWO2_02_FULL_49_11]|uniref:Uncharacterized protein n=1 Tax=Candidatus Uhrbacteria bacterium RIFCSPLOWO2_02_FULL_49_11 TaxID=1802409 RepID=A0A1F7VBA8_9BACT|nr:MAG: hypothetical protein A3I42_00360 [Candidatus Uhrbacteria bacterium RIFCSPLOWO2_02_FULL_49_11]